MENQNIVVVKKKSTFWTVVKILLVVGAVCLVAAKIYQKFFKKKNVEVLDEADEAEVPEIAEINAVADTAEEESFEVSAESVIANAEDMEDTAPVAEV